MTGLESRCPICGAKDRRSEGPDFARHCCAPFEMLPVITVTIRKRDGEYRVPGPAHTEAQAYYTDDKADAIATACSMHGCTIDRVRVR